MALTADETRRIYLHMGVFQVSAQGVLVGGVPALTAVTQKLQGALDSLTTNGETTVRELLGFLDAKRTSIIGMDSHFQAQKVGQITLNDKEFAQRLEHYNWIRAELARVLDVPFDMETEADSGNGPAQGPWREP